MRVLSLFDGISGAAQALKELGIDCEYYASEIDKFAIQVSRKNHPDIVQIGDIKGIEFEDSYIFYNQNNDPMQNGGSFKGDIDLLIGGSPCQDLSCAKNGGKGLNGEKSGLFYEYVRILKAVKPKYFILENVASMKKEARDTITQELFSIEPILINSALVVAQQRKRLYWVGRLVGDKYEQVKIDQPEDRKIFLKDIIENGDTEKLKSYCITATYTRACLKDYFEKSQRQLIFVGCAMRGRNLIDEKRKDVLGAKTSQRVEFRSDEKVNCLTSVNKDCLICYSPIKLGQIEKGGQGNRIYSSQGKSICLSASSGGLGSKTGLYDVQNLVRKLTPIECERLQGFPDNYGSCVSDSQRYKALGNSFTVPVIKHILKLLHEHRKA